MSAHEDNAEFRQHIRSICTHDRRYAEEAFAFVHQAVSYSIQRLAFEYNSAPSHISGPTLLDVICELALEYYGPLALDVLRSWGLYTTADIGNVVFLQVQHGLLGASAEDSMDDFSDKFDFEQVFLESYSENPEWEMNLPRIQ